MTWLWFLLKVGVVLAIVFTVCPALTLAERRISAFIQGRVGPNRVGPFGALQPVADMVKFFMKEVLIPGQADRALFMIAPLLMFVPPLLGWAVIPFGNQIGEERLQIANLGIGVLFIMAVLSVGVYGVTLGGWASNNKYSLLGSLRAAAQLISYELSLGLSILLVVMMGESLDLNVIVMRQATEGWNIFGGGTWWLLPSGLVGALLFFTVALAENNRLPFDMAECESELVGGFHTEYSAMGGIGAIMFSEYIAMTLNMALFSTLFLGGWHLPFLIDPTDTSMLAGALSVAVLVGKVVTLCLIIIWIRWTFPRFRYDQIMSLGWKRFLPIALVNLGVVALVGVFLVEG